MDSNSKKNKHGGVTAVNTEKQETSNKASTDLTGPATMALERSMKRRRTMEMDTSSTGVADSESSSFRIDDSQGSTSCDTTTFKNHKKSPFNVDALFDSISATTASNKEEEEAFPTIGWLFDDHDEDHEALVSAPA
jgi:hypothetical protein